MGDSGQASTRSGDEPTIGITPPRSDGLEVVERLARYVVLEEIGRGGMGRVYRGYDPKLAREVALKVLSLAVGDEGRARLIREAQALAKLSHPNVVAVYDVEQHEGQPFIAMELVSGRTLAQWVREQEPSPSARMDALRQAGAGLAAAHAQGLVHRDFKPSNVLIGEDGRARVTDFGLARPVDGIPSPASGSPVQLDGQHGSHHDSATADLTADGIVLGTPGYMAPEQHFGQVADARSDQYGFCVTAYEVLTGERLFSGRDGLAALAKAKTKAEWSWPPTIARWVALILHRGLSPNPADRHPSMDALLEALGRDPSSSRRRRLGMAGLGAAGIAIVLGVRLNQERLVAQCEQAGDEIAQTWSDAEHEAIREGLLGSGSPSAAGTAERTIGWLDRYAEQWRVARVQTCRLTTIDGQRSAELDARSVECLTERRAQLGALVDQLRDASATVEARAVGAASGLPSIEPCTNDAWLLQRLAPPEGAKARAEVTALRGRLAQAGAAIGAARLDAAKAQLDALQSQAEVLGWAPLQAEVLATQAKLAEAQGSYGAARELGERAYLLALESGHDELAAGSSRRLASLVGRQLDDLDRGLTWVAVSERWLSRLGKAEGLAEASVHRVRAGLLKDKAELDDAQIASERGLALAELTLGEGHPGLRPFLVTMADVASTRGDYQRARDLYARLYAVVREAYGDEHPDTVRALGRLAQAESRTGDHDLALAHFEQSIGGLEAIFGTDHPDVAQMLGNYGGTLNTLGRTREAIEAHERALAIKERVYGPRHTAVASSLNSLGNAYFMLEDHEQALSAHRRALQIWETTLGHDHPDLGYSYNNIGNAHVALEAYDDALAAYARAVEVWREHLGPEHPQLAYALYGTADAHIKSGHPQRAIPFARQVVAIREKAAVSQLKRGLSHFLLARALGSDPDSTEARALAERARKELAEAGFVNYVERVDTWLSAR